MAETEPVGLRELKKQRLREHIRACARAQFAEHGYRETTMEQIAAVAEVAPRTVYRYFPSKDALVVGDEDDERMLASFRSALASHSPIEALRIAFGELAQDDADGRERLQRELVAAHPELQAAVLRQVIRLADEYAAAIVEQAEPDADPDAALALTGAVVGIALVTLVRWDLDGVAAEQAQRFSRGLDRLSAGFGVGGGAVSPAPRGTGSSSGDRDSKW